MVVFSLFSSLPLIQGYRVTATVRIVALNDREEEVPIRASEESKSHKVNHDEPSTKLLLPRGASDNEITFLPGDIYSISEIIVEVRHIYIYTCLQGPFLLEWPNMTRRRSVFEPFSILAHI